VGKLEFIEFERVCRKGGIPLNEAQRTQLQDYVNLLLQWNSRINLISRRSVENVWTEQILHCLAPWTVIRFPESHKILDLGTGGGLPGIPLAIVRPDADIVLLDSVRKKTDAVREIVKALGLKRVSVATGRAEELGRRSGFAGAFGAVLARGVAPLEDLIRWAGPMLARSFRGKANLRSGQRPFLLEGPTLVALKGGDLAAELRRAAVKTGERDLEVFNVPLLDEIETGLEGKKLVVVRFGGGKIGPV
jgi:16S rRNA (guanine527-N7)-methyltransferase